jgi:glycosyltransferase involved in cell wall biosynthesis
MDAPVSIVLAPLAGEVKSVSPTRWVLLTGEYPPQPGGVSDYTRLVAQGLADAGDEVFVWAPACAAENRNPKSEIGNTERRDFISDFGFRISNSPQVHRLPGKFGSRDLEILENSLKRLPRPFRLLVQYVPHAFGAKGMNVPFCWWLSRRPEPVWVMFHEVAFPFLRRQPLAHQMLAVVNRVMSELVARRAEKIFVSILAWEKLLPKSVRSNVTWLPVPSTMSTILSKEEVAAIRRRIVRENEIVLGHFGTYAGHVTSLLISTLPCILKKDVRRRVLLLGRGSEEFAALLREGNPDLRDRINATGPRNAEEIAAHLAACDCIVQPYTDGVSSRRTSLLASLALGLPIVTNLGPLTDPIWQETKAVLLAPSSSSTELIAAVEDLLADRSKREELGNQAARFYRDHFALERTIETLRRAVGNYKLAS